MAELNSEATNHVVFRFPVYMYICIYMYICHGHVGTPWLHNCFCLSMHEEQPTARQCADQIRFKSVSKLFIDAVCSAHCTCLSSFTENAHVLLPPFWLVSFWPYSYLIHCSWGFSRMCHAIVAHTNLGCSVMLMLRSFWLGRSGCFWQWIYSRAFAC